MSHQLLDLFTENYPIKVTPALANAVIKFTTAFELKNTHPLALNTYTLGIYQFHFLPVDRDAFLNLFQTSERDISKLLRPLLSGKMILGATNTELRTMLKNVDSVNSNFKVASDPYNLFSIYLLYCFNTSSLPQKLKHEVCIKIVLLLEYKFFTSLVNHRFPYRANEQIMTAMFENLSGKFDIKVYGTWKNVMVARAEDILAEDSIHNTTFEKFNDDKAIIYVVTDIQTRIRSQINLVTAEYMKAKATNDTIGTYSSIGNDLEGEKVLLDNASVYDVMFTSVYTNLLSITKWLDDSSIRLIAGLFTALNANAFRSFLIRFSELAVKQKNSGESKKIVIKDDQEYYVGCEILIEQIIQKSFRFCTHNGIDIRKPLNVLKALKNVYSASRVQDKNILILRDSVSIILDDIAQTTREATLSALRIGLMLYIIINALKYSK